MALMLKILRTPRMGGFEARIEFIPEGARSTTSSKLMWSGFFETEEEARWEGEKELEWRRGRG